MIGLEHHLSQTIAVAQIDENLVVVGPIAVDPAVEHNRLSDMGLPQFAAGMCSLPLRHVLALCYHVARFLLRSRKRAESTRIIEIGTPLVHFTDTAAHWEDRWERSNPGRNVFDL